MISFRYHLVSIIAVFLALALGIIVGASGLRGPVLDDLHKQVATLKGENSKLRGQNDQLAAQFNNADRFASTYASKILKDTLTGHTVADHQRAGRRAAAWPRASAPRSSSAAAR